VDTCYFGPQGQRTFGANKGTDYWHDIPDLKAYYQNCNDNILVGALLEDQGSIDNIDEILGVDGINYFGIGPNDLSQGIGYPGEPGHPEVERATQELTNRIREAGRQMVADVLESEWISTVLIDDGRKVLDRRKC